MSHTDLHQLSKKNQEFIRIAKHQLLENGKTEEEAESLIQEILPAIHENQGKGIPARTLFGAPTVWANSFSEKERYEKEHPKLNDAPSLMILDSFLFIFGVFAAISAFMNLVAPRRTGYGLITLILGSLTGALLLYLMYYFFYQYMDGTKRSQRASFSLEIHADSCWSHVPLGHCLVLYFLTPTSSQPNYSRCFCHRFRSSSACPSLLPQETL